MKTHVGIASVSVLLWVVSLTGCAKPAAQPDEESRRVDALFADVDPQRQPGCSAGVIHRGEFLHRAGYGAASLDYGVPLSSHSVFRIASISKQFTAMAILLLEEEGRLSLDDDVRKHLPQLVDYGHRVTLRQMLLHTSGMSDYEGDESVVFANMQGEKFRWGNEDYLTVSEFLGRLATVPLRTPPETEYRYSNSAYFLLGQVVEAASGESLHDYAQRRIFEPLQMRQTLFNDNANRVIPNRATGYHKNVDGEYEVYETNLDWVGDGGVYTSIDDFIRWDRNFYRNTLGKGLQSLIVEMERPSALENYGLGLEIGDWQGLRTVQHSGSWVAFNTFYARIPELELSVVVFCNTEEIDAESVSGKILEIYGPRILAGKDAT
jgi:CubicO group peptidase (beta-lactamase class C family)